MVSGTHNCAFVSLRVSLPFPPLLFSRYPHPPPLPSTSSYGKPIISTPGDDANRGTPALASRAVISPFTEPGARYWAMAKAESVSRPLISLSLFRRSQIKKESMGIQIRERVYYSHRPHAYSFVKWAKKHQYESHTLLSFFISVCARQRTPGSRLCIFRSSLSGNNSVRALVRLFLESLQRTS